MKSSHFAFGALLALAGLGAAQADVYTYTGNVTTFDTINATPTQIVAHFEFDFDDSPMAEYDTYAFKSWDVSYGSIKLGSATGDFLMNRFTFDSAKNVTGWFFNASDSEDIFGYTRNIQSISQDFIFFAPNEAHDIAIWADPLEVASIYGAPGTWSVAAAVPEPSTWLMLGAGLAAIGFARRRSQGRAA